MAKIDRAYIATALILLVLGMALGFYMGAAGDGTVRDTHVAILLPGFVTLAVYGVIYRLWPAMKESALARVQFWSAAIGAGLMIVGAYLFQAGMGVTVIAIGSVLAILAAVLITILFWTRSEA
jgi:peptidoglycan/LPS O-acetylase OafA/YrhL